MESARQWLRAGFYVVVGAGFVGLAAVAFHGWGGWGSTVFAFACGAIGLSGVLLAFDVLLHFLEVHLKRLLEYRENSM